jgi:hypothetical protein
LAGAGAIAVGYAWIDARNEQRARVSESTYSFLYYADNANILDLSKWNLKRKESMVDRIFRKNV